MYRTSESIIGVGYGKYTEWVCSDADGRWQAGTDIPHPSGSAARVTYNVSGSWAAVLEHYADYGRLRRFEPLSRQQQTLFAVIDYKGAR